MVFKHIAAVGESTMGWLYGFKFYLIVNEKVDILNFVITQGNVDDRAPLYDSKFLIKIKENFMEIKGIFKLNSLNFYLSMDFN